MARNDLNSQENGDRAAPAGRGRALTCIAGGAALGGLAIFAPDTIGPILYVLMIIAFFWAVHLWVRYARKTRV